MQQIVGGKTSPDMRLLFISRSFPPVVGGIEQQNYEIYCALSSLCPTTIIANSKGKYLLPVFLPYALLRALLGMRRYDAVLLGDGVLAIVGYLLKLLTGKPVLSIVHGLDITYRSTLYQKFWVGIFLPRLDRLIAVGNETIRQGVLRGIPLSHFVFIANGVATPPTPSGYTRHDLETLAGRKLKGRILLTLGRLVKRKGTVWFIENVVPTLDRDLTYIIAGAGNEENAIREAIDKHGLAERVVFLGGVSEQQKRVLYETADLFIQPNIPVDGDIEGFGLVVLEAAANGIPVVASRLEGLKDAIKEGNNGFLVESMDAAAFKSRIEALLDDSGSLREIGKRAQEFVAKHYSWDHIARLYLDAIGCEQHVLPD